MTREGILDKIKKLIALSENNPSQEESYSALMKAQALMAQYKVEEGEINPEQKEECVHVMTNYRYATNSVNQYLTDLATIIADNFCCISYLNRFYGSRSKYISFMGLKKDLDVVLEAYEIAVKAIDKNQANLWKEMSKERHHELSAAEFNPYKTGYIRGYLCGLKDNLESQREDLQEWGLVLVAPPEAQDYLKSLNTNLETRRRGIDDTYYDLGYQDGQAFNMNKQIEEGR